IWVLYEADEGYDISGLNPFDMLPTGMKAKLIAIPTTSGTGAEVTGAVVLTDTETSLKLELLSRFAIPTIAIVDPVFVDNMPKKLTASTAFDAIGHCMEGITSTWGNVYTDGLTAQALKMLFKNLSKAYHDSDPDAREAMHVGASIAGLAFGNAQAQLGHAFAHQIGAIFHVPHGFGVGLVLPYFMELMINNDPKAVKIFSELAMTIGVADWSDDDKTAGNKLIEKVRELQDEVDFPTKLSDLGITKEKLDENEQKFRDLIVQAGTFTMSNVSINTDTAWKMMQYMLEGKSIDF
ncbi:MAG: iron-containing alcohol dehydrogenase, partial [Candidatus Hodarchaeota archaeon]